MPFKARLKRILRSYTLRVSCAALMWLILISLMHYYFNRKHENRISLKMGYMPVITNLAAPLLDFVSEKEKGNIHFQSVKFASFAEMAEAFRNDLIEAAFIIAPLSIVLLQQGEDVRIVYIGNRHESTLVIRKDLQSTELKELGGRKVAVPTRYSGHNLTLQRLIRSCTLKEKIQVIEMNPPDMASALTAGSLDAYFVGEPFGAMTLNAGESKLLFYVEQVQPNFICNLMIVKQMLIDKEPEAVRMLVESAARAGIWAQKNKTEAARICSQYWGQPSELVEYALTTPTDRVVFNKFIPSYIEMKAMADEMVEFGLIKNGDIRGLVDDRFALAADIASIDRSVSSIIKK